LHLSNTEEFSVLRRPPYDGAVFGFGTLGRRLLEGGVGLFALLGFLYVPLGHHTGFEHVRAIFSTPAASAAFAELTQAALDLRQRALELVTGAAAPPTPPTDPRPTGHDPRPIPPKLK
jgi:hypothetical protein